MLFTRMMRRVQLCGGGMNTLMTKQDSTIRIGPTEVMRATLMEEI